MSGSFTLLPGEEVYLESSKVPLTLTNFRVCHRYIFYPDPQYDSITLEAIASTVLRTISRLWLLISAGVLFLLALAAGQQPFGRVNSAAGFLTFVAVGLVVIYFLTRRRTIIVESAGGFLMQVPARELSLDECYFMVQAIDRAKLEFQAKLPQQP